ncbi:MAG: response regulator [Oscillospiraceae bacterium]|nr:response regulator [Oscillospiraceae bacterium]
MEALKVFLVEDESVVREGLRDMIPWEQNGFVFSGEAPDGEVALPALRRLRPDILITDIKMPFMDGLAMSRLINRELPETRIIILSGYDDFEYAQKAIELHVDQYLLKPITKAGMIRALEETRRRIEEEREQTRYLQIFNREARAYEDYSRQRFFEKLAGGKMGIQEIYEEAGRLELDLDAEGYNLLLFVLQPRESGAAYSEETAALEESILQYFLRFPDILLFRSSLLSRALLLKGSREKLRELAEKCIDAIRQRCAESRCAPDWTVAVSTPTERLSGIPHCYAEAVHILAFRHLMPRRHVLTAEITGRAGKDAGLADAVDSGKADPMLIRNFVQNGFADEIEDFVTEYLGNLEPGLRSMMFRHYLIFSWRINAAAAVAELGLSREALIARLPAADADLTAEELRGYLTEVLASAIGLRNEESGRQNSDLVEQAILYVDQHYTEEDLSLNSVARAVNISTNYLSALFGQKVGLSFVEYLTQKRMTRAKQLLRQSDRRSGEIAQEVGYRDAHYFSFVFKKTQGCTPREYRSGERGR